MGFFFRFLSFGWFSGVWILWRSFWTLCSVFICGVFWVIHRRLNFVSKFLNTLFRFHRWCLLSDTPASDFFAQVSEHCVPFSWVVSFEWHTGVWILCPSFWTLCSVFIGGVFWVIYRRLTFLPKFLNTVFRFHRWCLLGDTPASEFYVPTFRDTATSS